MNAVSFFIPGKIQGKERPKFNRYTGRTYTPENTMSYENFVKVCYKEIYGDFSFPSDIPLVMEIIAVYPIPVSSTKKNRELMRKFRIVPTKKPDCDNIAKAICDGLNLVAYHDDSQIVALWIAKWYENDDFLPGAYVTIRERE